MESKSETPAGTTGLPCDEECENRELAQWDGHFIQQCKRHPQVIRAVCMEAKIEQTKNYLKENRVVIGR